MRHALLPLLVIVAIGVAVPTSVSAQERTEVRSQREDAGARVRQVERSGGRVLQAEPMQRGGEEVYRLKVLTPEGRVRVISGDDDRRERPREDLTARRRDFRDDQGSDAARERQQRMEAQRRDARSRAEERDRGDRGNRGERRNRGNGSD